MHRQPLLLAVSAVLVLAGCSDDAAPVGAAGTASTATAAGAGDAVRAKPPDEVRDLLARAGSGLRSSRSAALDALDRAGEVAVRRAESALADPVPEVREGAIHFLARAADARSTPALAGADPRLLSGVEEDLVAALRRCGTPGAAETLLARVGGAEARSAFLAGAALRDFAGDVPREPLRRMADGMPEDGGATHVRQAALLALAGHAEASDRALFERASSDDTAAVRAAAAEGLLAPECARRGDVSRLLADPDELVRMTTVIRATTLHCAWVAQELRVALTDRRSDVRAAAVTALGSHPGDDACAALVEVLRNDREKSYIRAEAARSLVAVDRDRGLALLRSESATYDRVTRDACEQLLAGTGRD